MCGKLGLSRQSYYRGRRRRRRRQVDEELVIELVGAERRLQPRLGTRKLLVRIKDHLAHAGVKMGRDRLFELLRQRGMLLEPLGPEYPRTTNSYHCLPVFRNAVSQLQVTRPNEVWVSDLTYLRTEEGFVYLALITDKLSRKIVGYHCGDTLEASGCLQALEMALAGLSGRAKPIHHSDQGCQYCSHEYVNRLVEHGLSISMTERDHCAENALAERINGILKTEYALGRRLPSKAVARAMVRQAVELYNTHRPHTALGYKTPSQVHSFCA